GVLEEAPEGVAEVERVAPDPRRRAEREAHRRTVPAAPPRGPVRDLPQQAVHVERDLDEDRVLLGREPPDGRLETLDGRREELLDRPAELGILPGLVEVREQQPETERDVLDVVDEDAVERRTQPGRGTAGAGHREPPAALPRPRRQEAHLDREPGAQDRL